jgi:hypothetical protein
MLFYHFVPQVLDKIMEHEKHRKQIEESRERLKRESAPQKENEAHEKLSYIKEKKDNITKEKVQLILIFIVKLLNSHFSFFVDL